MRSIFTLFLLFALYPALPVAASDYDFIGLNYQNLRISDAHSATVYGRHWQAVGWQEESTSLPFTWEFKPFGEYLFSVRSVTKFVWADNQQGQGVYTDCHVDGLMQDLQLIYRPWKHAAPLFGLSCPSGLMYGQARVPTPAGGFAHVNTTAYTLGIGPIIGLQLSETARIEACYTFPVLTAGLSDDFWSSTENRFLKAPIPNANGLSLSASIQF